MSVGRILKNQTRDDERRAYTELIKKYSKLLFDFGYRLCRNEDLVKDCMQQLFLDLWNKNFDLSRENTIKSYLLKAIRNRILREKAKWNNFEQLDEDYDFVLEIGIETKLIDHTTDCELAGKNIKCATTPATRNYIP